MGLPFDRVRQTTTTTGTGAFSLAAAILNTYRGFVATVGNGNTCDYTAVNRTANEWESGECTVNSGTPDTLTRSAAKVYDGSAGAGTLVNFSAGTKDIELSYPAKRGIVRKAGLTFTKGAIPTFNANGELDFMAAVGAFALGAGAGANAVGSVSGDDKSGVITVTTSVLDTPPANSDIMSITFGRTYNSVPQVVLQAFNDAAWALAYGIARCRLDDVTTGSFKLRSGSTPLPATTAATYKWVFMVMQ